MAGAGSDRYRLRRQRAPDGRPSDGGGAYQGQAARRPACAVLRPLRRAARRSAEFMGRRSLRAEDRGCLYRPANLWTRRRRRQGPADDLRGGLPRLYRDRRSALRRDDHAGRRGRNRFSFAAGLSGRKQEGALRRSRARLRHRHVGPRDAGHHHHAARADAGGSDDQGRQPRPPFRPLRRRGRQSDPRAVEDHRRPARRAGPRDAAEFLRWRGRPARGCR